MNDPRQSSVSFLESLGWKQCPSDKDYAIALYKRFEDVEPGCQCNDNGIQLYIELSYLKDLEYLAWTIELTAESLSEDWVEFKFYSLSIDELEPKLIPLSDKLIKAWKSIN
jgi:hypothetical protein